MKLISITALALLTSLAALPAQQASYTTYGKACGGLLGQPPIMPRIWAVGLPRLGTSFQVHYQGPRKIVNGKGCRETVGAFLLTGMSRDRLGSVRLPWRVPPGGYWLGGLACFLLTSGEVMQPPTQSSGTIGWVSFTVPNDPSLLGAKLYQQWWLFYMVACPNSILNYAFATNGGIMAIGK